jgi:hypothetical protein
MNKTNMIDMARSPSKRDSNYAAVEPTRDKYGYGTCLTLDAEAMKKLGIKELPEIGDEYHVMAVGKVIRASADANELNNSASFEIQLTHMNLTHEADVETPAKEKIGMKGVHFR